MIKEKRIQNENSIVFEDSVCKAINEVDNALSSAPLVIRQYIKYLNTPRGKFIRASSLLACALDKEGMVTENSVKLAAAIEILHLATLVHDDIVDDADIRRGAVTLQKKYGKRTAVICGDYLLCLALKIAASIDNKEEYINLDFTDYMGKICLGELKQHINNGNINLSFYQYLKIIAGKTAALFEFAFYAGALLCGDKIPDINQYKRLGRYLGLIFQLTDDCMDFESCEDVAKKPTQSDFEQGVITLPMIYAFQNLAGIKEKAKNGTLDKEELIVSVSKTGGLKFTHRIAKRYYDKSINIINELEASEEKKIILKSVLNKSFRIQN